MQCLELLLGQAVVVADVVGDESLPRGKVGVFAGNTDEMHTVSKFFLLFMHFLEGESAWVRDMV